MKRIAILGVTAVVLAMTTGVGAQTKNPRFGKWKLKQDAGVNIMTYEPSGANGMKVTVESSSPTGGKTSWWYTTEFDGKDMPVTGQAAGQTSAVTKVNDQINVITNKRDGKVTQVLYNILSKDRNSLGVMYYRDDGSGKTTNITFAMYERVPEK